MTICKGCQRHDLKLRKQYREANEDPEKCACGLEGKLEVDHDLSEYPYAFINYKGRSCNLKSREPYLEAQLKNVTRSLRSILSALKLTRDG